MHSREMTKEINPKQCKKNGPKMTLKSERIFMKTPPIDSDLSQQCRGQCAATVKQMHFISDILCAIDPIIMRGETIFGTDIHCQSMSEWKAKANADIDSQILDSAH